MVTADSETISMALLYRALRALKSGSDSARFSTSSRAGVRRIYMDGREHPEGWPFGWMGHSIGNWDGDTLVVDTVGLNDRTWMDRGGTPHSDALHVVERFRRVAHDTLEIDFLFDDPKAFTKPWGAKKVYRLRPDWEVLEDIACEEYLDIGKFR